MLLDPHKGESFQAGHSNIQQPHTIDSTHLQFTGCHGELLVHFKIELKIYFNVYRNPYMHYTLGNALCNIDISRYIGNKWCHDSMIEMILKYFVKACFCHGMKVIKVIVTTPQFHFEIECLCFAICFFLGEQSVKIVYTLYIHCYI